MDRTADRSKQRSPGWIEPSGHGCAGAGALRMLTWLPVQSTVTAHWRPVTSGSLPSWVSNYGSHGGVKANLTRIRIPPMIRKELGRPVMAVAAAVTVIATASTVAAAEAIFGSTPSVTRPWVRRQMART